MPNWCSNVIELNGPATTLNQVWEQATDPDVPGFLNALVPLKTEWTIDHAIESWGTKWDIMPDESSLEYSEYSVNGVTMATIEGSFDSAWSPPVAAITEFCHKNPDIDAELFYYEPANDYCGSLNLGDVEISSVGRDFFEKDPLGQQIDHHFDVISDLLYEQELMEEEIITEPLTLNNPEEEPNEKDVN
mgnify:CR=1 FL=1|jgi:hypothetical protein|tara:strand:- start:1240 stop:1806 length:567 start_codon:yes stop_codon:yes gene_type:complete